MKKLRSMATSQSCCEAEKKRRREVSEYSGGSDQQPMQRAVRPFISAIEKIEQIELL